MNRLQSETSDGDISSHGQRNRRLSPKETQEALREVKKKGKVLTKANGDSL